MVYANVDGAGDADGNANVEGEACEALRVQVQFMAMMILGAGIHAAPDEYVKSASADVIVWW